MQPRCHWENTDFEPSREAALRRLGEINPAAYAKTRNFLGGAVTRLSPYLTHGILSVPEVIHHLKHEHKVPIDDKLVFELAWREYFQHVWLHKGDEIFTGAKPLPFHTYHATVPDDIHLACTGVPVIDGAIRDLYQSGYVHNHARMWLACYVVHYRKVSWRAGAEWMYGHLLDGDLAANALSWQWVAGAWTGKPYLFNAENAQRYAPGYRSLGTCIDQTYATLEAIAYSADELQEPLDRHPSPTEEPLLYVDPPFDVAIESSRRGNERTDVLIHPWAIAQPHRHKSAAVGVLVREFHERSPWSERRWHFVVDGMTRCCREILHGDSTLIARALGEYPALTATETLNPDYRMLISKVSTQAIEVPRYFNWPQKMQTSFSRFWESVYGGDEHD